MNAKHTFKYSAEGFEDIAPVEITYEIPTGEATVTEMLRNFEYYLKAVGYYFDGHLDIVDETPDNIDTADEIYGCMADFDKECGCESTSSPLEADKMLKEWNEGIAKLDNEQKQKCMEEALKMSDLHYEATKDKKNMEAYKEAIKEAEDKYPVNILYKKIGTLNSEAEIELKKNKWFHGLCNPKAK